MASVSRYPHRRLARPCLQWLEDRLAPAFAPSLVADLNTQPDLT